MAGTSNVTAGKCFEGAQASVCGGGSVNMVVGTLTTGCGHSAQVHGVTGRRVTVDGVTGPHVTVDEVTGPRVTIEVHEDSASAHDGHMNESPYAGFGEVVTQVIGRRYPA